MVLTVYRGKQNQSSKTKHLHLQIFEIRMISHCYISCSMRKHRFHICENKGTDHRYYNPFTSYIRNFKPPAIFCGGVARYMSRVMRKSTFCICKNKDADQLCGNPEADQRLCFRYTHSKTPLLSTSEISST